MRKRIAITQRLDKVADRDEIRDGLDIRWGQLLWNIGYTPIPIANAVPLDALDSYFDSLKLDGVILSGGNDLGQYPSRDRIEERLLRLANKTHLPVLGICRGMQIINCFQGGDYKQIEHHVGTEHNLLGDWAQKNQITKVNSYHNNGIFDHNLGSNLIKLAYTADGSIEAVRHQNWPWLGLMWHPERGSTDYRTIDVILKHLG